MRTAATLACMILAACDGPTVSSWQAALSWPAPALCTVTVKGKGDKDLENDYLPRVITCENGLAEDEALKAQAVAARAYAYYKMALQGSLADGTADQVYTCSTPPEPRHFAAVKATAGQVLVWGGVVTCSFFVAGAKPSTESCVAASGDPDPTKTERYVTYNDGKSGSAIEQTSLGWVDPSNKENRGCFSQNGSRCLAKKGFSYISMLRFYYGADMRVETASGPCTVPPLQPDGGSPPDQSLPDLTDLGPVASDDAAPGRPDGGRSWGGGCACSAAGAPGSHTLPLLPLAAVMLAWRICRARQRRGLARTRFDA